MLSVRRRGRYWGTGQHEGATGATVPAGATGEVSLTEVQTLTNKTLTGPKIGTILEPDE